MSLRSTNAVDDPLVLFQVPNQIGLGHMNRMACVALALGETDPDVRVLFIVEGFDHGLLQSLSLPYVTLPAAGLLKPPSGWRQWSQRDRGHLFQSVADAILFSSQPAMVVFDCFPNPQMLQAARDRNIPCILCLRKMKDFRAYSSMHNVRPILGMHYPILVPHEESEFKLPSEYKDRTIYLGPIAKPLPGHEEIMARMASRSEKVLVICAGGGGHPDTPEFFNFASNAFCIAAEAHSSLNAYLIAGPMFSQWSRLNLQPRLHIIPFDPEFAFRCATADLVISQAGYNSMNELACLGVPTICVPASRGYDDQFERAHAMANQCPNIVCFDGKTPDDLARLINTCLAASLRRPVLAAPDGAYRGAFHLMKLLGRL